MSQPVETGEQDGLAVCVILLVLLLQAVADAVVPLSLVDCFG